LERLNKPFTKLNSCLTQHTLLKENIEKITNKAFWAKPYPKAKAFQRLNEATIFAAVVATCVVSKCHKMKYKMLRKAAVTTILA